MPLGCMRSKKMSALLKIWKEILPKVKSTLRFAPSVYSPLLKLWWMTISRLTLLWQSCCPAFAQPAVKLSLKAVVKSCSSIYCHSLNYDIMSWLHKRTIIWGSSYQDRAKRRGFMSALHLLWTSENCLASLAKIYN